MQTSLKVVATAIALGVLANTIGIPAFAKDRDMTGSARATAIHDCNIEANKFNPITQLPNQFAVYGTCMANQPFKVAQSAVGPRGGGRFIDDRCRKVNDR